MNFIWDKKSLFWIKSLYSTLRWIFFVVIEIQQGNENSFLIKVIHCDENLKMCWIFTIMLEIYHYYELASLWWNFILMMKIDDCNEGFFIVSQMWWIVVILIEINHCNEHSALRWEFIIVMKIHQYDENCLYQIYHFDEVRST